MAPESQILLAVAIPSFAVPVGILLNARQAERLDRHMDAQLASFRSEMNARFNAVDAHFDTVDARFAAAHEALLRVEGVMDARLRHLELKD